MLQSIQNPVVKTQLVFYTEGGVGNNQPVCIDEICLNSDGQRVGLYSRLTEAQLAEKHRPQSILTATINEFAKLNSDACKTKPQRIDEDDWVSALECLPPLKWRRSGRVESFMMSEFYSMNITTIYARQEDDTCWKFRDDAGLTAQEIADRILAAQAAELEVMV